MFLFTAAVANALKQMAMLTSSSTRNAIYKSFSRNADNIGDITAKGEAQIAVIDLLGMFAGICISRLIGVSRMRLLTIFTVFSMCDLVCIFNEIKSVVFNTLNFERVSIILSKLFHDMGNCTESVSALRPDEVARRETIFMPTMQGEDLVRTWSTLSCHPDVLKECFSLFSKTDNFIVALDVRELASVADMVKIRSKLNTVGVVCRIDGKHYIFTPQVMLHTSAKSADIFKALIVVCRIRHELKSDTQDCDWSLFMKSKSQIKSASSDSKPHNLLSSNGLVDIVSKAYIFQQSSTPLIIDQFNSSGWDMGRFTFGTIANRIEYGKSCNIDDFTCF